MFTDTNFRTHLSIWHVPEVSAHCLSNWPIFGGVGVASLTALLHHFGIALRTIYSALACLHTVFIHESNKQKNRMDESKTKESILVFYKSNIDSRDNIIIFSITKTFLKSLSRCQIAEEFQWCIMSIHVDPIHVWMTHSSKSHDVHSDAMINKYGKYTWILVCDRSVF